MEMISLIMSGLALLAAMVCLGLNVQNEKRSKKQRAAMADWINAEMKAVSTASAAYVNEQLTPIHQKVEQLEKGITPDYEQAKAAAEAVNSFNQGISNILGFDPVTAMQAQRQKKELGEYE